MIDKLKALFGSLRFWVILLASITAILQSISLNGGDLVSILDIIRNTLIAIVGLGTLDSVSEKMGSAIGGKKPKR